MIKVFGITNCSTVKKARDWLEKKNLGYEFWDFKKLGIDKDHLQKWCNEFGWEKVLNTKGMMWRKATQTEKNKVKDESSAIDFMLKVPNSIKRPVIEFENDLLIGFDEENYQSVFKS